MMCQFTTHTHTHSVYSFKYTHTHTHTHTHTNMKPINPTTPQSGQGLLSQSRDILGPIPSMLKQGPWSLHRVV